jgi:hypothetical protein
MQHKNGTGYLPNKTYFKVMKYPVYVFLFSVLAVTEAGGQTPFQLDGQPFEKTDFGALNQVFTNYSLFKLESESLFGYTQTDDNSPKTIALNLPEVGNWLLALRPRHLLQNSYRLIVDDQPVVSTLKAYGNITWQGTIQDLPNSKVSLTICPGYIFGSIRAGNDVWFIEPVGNLVKNGPRDLFVVYQTEDVIPNTNFVCGVTEVRQRKREYPTQSTENESGMCRHIEVAIASPHDMFQHHGSVMAVESHNIGMMNEVANDYDDAFADAFYFLIAAQFIASSQTSSLDIALTSSTASGVLLYNLTNWGEAGVFQVPYDICLLWTARDICVGANCLVAGYTNLEGTCSSGRYALLQDVPVPDPGGSGGIHRVLVSHEIGHLMGCDHVDSPVLNIMYFSAQNTSFWAPESVAQLNAYLPSMFCLSPCGVNFTEPSVPLSEGGPYNEFLPANVPNCSMGYIDKEVLVHYSGTGLGDTVLVVVSGGAAIEGVDYQLLNPNIVFPSGAVAQIQKIKLRVPNDAISEGDKTVLLNLEGTSVGVENQILVHLYDDDKDPASSFFQYVQTGAFNGSPTTGPFLGAYADAQTQYIVSAAELLGMGLRPQQEILALDFNVSSKNSTQPFQGLTIAIKHTSNSIDFSNEVEIGGFSEVFHDNFSTALGWNHFDFSTPFIWDGVSNLAFKICFDNSSVSASDMAYTFPGGQVKALLGGVANPGTGCTLDPNPVSTIVGRRPRMRLYNGNNIAVNLQDAASTELKSGQTAYFKDEQNEFILAIQQISNTGDAGCVQVEIDRAGVGQQSPNWLPSGTFITDKAFFVTMDNPEVVFDITLYYNQDEMAIWGNAQGSLNFVKSIQPISISDGLDCWINSDCTMSTFGPVNAPQVYYGFKGRFRHAGGFALTNAEGKAVRRDRVGMENPGVNSRVVLYPNPAKDYVTLRGKSDETYQCSLFDLCGKLILQETLRSLDNWSLARVPTGVYWAELTASNGERSQIKLVKQ